MSVIDTDLLLTTGLGALGVISGVVLKNTTKDLKSGSSNLGKVLFIGGWAVVGYALKGTGWGLKTILAFIITVIIVMVVIGMISMQSQGRQVPIYMPVLFSMAWVILGASLGILRNNNIDGLNMIIGIFASVLVITSMLIVLPWQREKCLAYGPGLIMFGLAWAIITLVNSLPQGLSA